MDFNDGFTNKRLALVTTTWTMQILRKENSKHARLQSNQRFIIDVLIKHDILLLRSVFYHFMRCRIAPYSDKLFPLQEKLNIYELKV